MTRRPPRATRTDTLFPYTNALPIYRCRATAQRVDIAQQHLATQRALEQSADDRQRSEEHTSELQSLMRISYAVFCLKKKINRHYYKEMNQVRQQQHAKHKMQRHNNVTHHTEQNRTIHNHYTY